jgi:hypothetical protein
VLPNGELSRNRDDILVDVQGRPHKAMLAHHRIRVVHTHLARHRRLVLGFHSPVGRVLVGDLTEQRGVEVGAADDGVG